MGLKEWWESRQQKKLEHQNEQLLETAAHPQQGVVDGGTEDLDEIRTDLGTSKMGEMSMDDSKRIE
jgi:hypothetical protein